VGEIYLAHFEQQCYLSYNALQLGNIKLYAKFELLASVHFRDSRLFQKWRHRTGWKDTTEFPG